MEAIEQMSADNIPTTRSHGREFSWGLHAENQVCLNTDSGSNIVRAAGILKWTRLACFGHNLHLAVTNSLNKDPRCNRALGVAHKITSAFSMSWKRRRDLAQAQIELNYLSTH